MGSANFTISFRGWVERTEAVGITARQFKEANPKAKGNLRDNASAQQLLVLASLEVSNAELIEQGLPKPARILRLNKRRRNGCCCWWTRHRGRNWSSTSNQ